MSLPSHRHTDDTWQISIVDANVVGCISVPPWTQIIWWVRTWVQITVRIRLAGTPGFGRPAAGSAGRTSVGAFLPLCPKPMLGPETCASVRLEKGYTVINGKHLLGSSPGSVVAKTRAKTSRRGAYTTWKLEEEAMRRDSLAEEEKKTKAPGNFEMERENSLGKSEYRVRDSAEGNRAGSCKTRPASMGFPGLMSAGGDRRRSNHQEVRERRRGGVG